jgi:hypothetical protein
MHDSIFFFTIMSPVCKALRSLSIKLLESAALHSCKDTVQLQEVRIIRSELLMLAG